jgi:phenylacetate-coenzyme A ligase PaaK-like adenylate-forming protein
MDVRDAAALARFPLTRRAELVEDQLAHPPLGSRRPPTAPAPVRAGASGTGASLLVLAWSAAELARERRAGTRLLGRLGVRPGMRVANTLPGALVTPGSLLLGDVIEELGALDVPLGAVNSAAAAKQAWELVDRVEPEVIILDPGSSAALLAAAPERGRPWWRGIVWLAGAEIVLPPAAGFTGWARTWLAVPEATSFVAGSCSAGRFHVDDEVIAEVVDDAGTAAAAGALALTPLGFDAPLRRYATGIAARAVTGACSCGAPGPVVEVQHAG